MNRTLCFSLSGMMIALFVTVAIHSAVGNAIPEIDGVLMLCSATAAGALIGFGSNTNA